jgi:hypothetical protein
VKPPKWKWVERKQCEIYAQTKSCRRAIFLPCLQGSSLPQLQPSSNHHHNYFHHHSHLDYLQGSSEGFPEASLPAWVSFRPSPLFTHSSIRPVHNNIMASKTLDPVDEVMKDISEVEIGDEKEQDLGAPLRSKHYVLPG